MARFQSAIDGEGRGIVTEGETDDGKQSPDYQTHSASIGRNDPVYSKQRSAHRT